MEFDLELFFLVLAALVTLVSTNLRGTPEKMDRRERLSRILSLVAVLALLVVIALKVLGD